MFYPRDITPALERELETDEIIIITGMRQVGKTTMLNHLMGKLQSKNKLLLDLENPLHRNIFEIENYDAVWNNLTRFGITKEEKAYLFLDEVQNLPDISRVVKYLYDHYKTKFFLTGSSSYYLKNLFPESLAGRKFIFELFPLTFREFLCFKSKAWEAPNTFAKTAAGKNQITFEQQTPYYLEFLEFGGFPKVVLSETPERKKAILSEIFTSYFEKDAKSLADFRDMSKLRDLILLLIPRLSSKLEINKLASELSLSRETIYTYLSFLEQTYFISLLPRYSGSVDRQAAGSKKLFFCDTGMANILGKISLGQAFEQSVFQNLRSQHELSYYSKEGRAEIDFIVDKKIALEIKLSASRQDIENLKRRTKSLKVSEQYLVTLNYNEEKEVILANDI